MYLAAVLLAYNMKDPKLAHARTEFRFSVNLSYNKAFPLFGAWAEKQWAPDWNPQFVYPNPPADKEGAVFRVDHGSHSSAWIMTRFDPAAGRVQYALLIDNLVLTRINIEVKRNGPSDTGVSVAYEWTALNPSGNDQVKRLAKQYEEAGPEWQSQINAYAAKIENGH